MSVTARVMETLLRVEGGDADLEHDAGGRTYFGVSQLARAEFVGLGYAWPPTRETALGFYLEWWRQLDLESLDLTYRVALQAFLFRVHTNPTEMTRAFQVACCAAGEPLLVDGRMGPLTREAIRNADEGFLYTALRAAIGMWSTTRPLWKRYGAAWLSNRLRMG